MVDNIERVLERGEKIELLVDKTDNLRFQVCSSIDRTCHSCRAACDCFMLHSCQARYATLLLRLSWQLSIMTLQGCCICLVPVRNNPISCSKAMCCVSQSEACALAKHDGAANLCYVS